MTKAVPKFALSYIIACFSLFICLDLDAQDQNFEEFKKQYSASYQNYHDSVNVAFEGFLQAAWIEIQAQKPTDTYSSPKPEALPVLKPIPEEYVKKKPAEVQNSRKDLTKDGPQTLSPTPNKAPINAPPTSSYGLVFFGKFWELSFLQSSVNTQIEATNYSESYFAEQWEKLKGVYTESKITEISNLLGEQEATDWSTFLFIQQWIAEQQKIPSQTRDLHLWFIMQQLGYDFRIGYVKDKSLVLAAFDQPLFGVTYYSFSGKKYYVIQNSQKIEGRIKTYDGVLGKDLRWRQQVPYNAFDNKQKEERVLKFPFKGEKQEITLALNPSHIAYQEQLLRSKPELYSWFNPSASVISQLDTALIPTLESLSKEEQINYLLAMVQYSFIYQTDTEQFGFEKFMTPEECLWNTASDCEDRTALFAWLIERYTKLDYLFVRYPTHIALAIDAKELNLDLKLSTLNSYRDTVNKKTYVVADPTYIGASLGLEMPKLLKSGRLTRVN